MDPVYLELPKDMSFVLKLRPHCQPLLSAPGGLLLASPMVLASAISPVA
jgi:hypothetical protein